VLPAVAAAGRSTGRALSIGRSASAPSAAPPPAKSLLEAAARRVAFNDISEAAADSAPDRDDGGLPVRFIEAYLVAVRDADVK
jgi:hypothetical protein